MSTESDSKSTLLENNQRGDDSYAKELQQQIEAAAAEKVRALLARLVYKLCHYDAQIVSPKFATFTSDFPYNFASMMELHQLGLAQDVVDLSIHETKKSAGHDLKFSLERLSPYQFASRLEQGDPTVMHTAIGEYVRSTEVVLAIVAAVHNYLQPSEVQLSAAFDTTSDPFITATVLEEISVIKRSTELLTSNLGSNIDQIVQPIVEKTIDESVVVSDKSRRMVAELEPGLELIFTQPISEESKSTSHWNIAVQADLAILSQEVANQSPRERCEPFVLRSTGKECVAAMQSAGLRFSSQFEQFVVSGESTDFLDRYGGPFTHISRLLAKVIWSGDMGRLADIFVSTTGEKITLEQLESFAQYQTDDEGLRLLQAIMSQLVHKQDLVNDVSMTEQRIAINDGACFDVASYYVQALDLWQLWKVPIDKAMFLEKTHGSHTFLNIQPIVFNGLQLPKGCLFTRDDDGKLGFLRLTPFALDSREAMVAAFGTEVLKAEANGGNLQKVLDYMRGEARQ